MCVCTDNKRFVSCVACAEEERTTRRISYLRATAWGDRMSVDDLAAGESSESEPAASVVPVVAQQK